MKRKLLTIITLFLFSQTNAQIQSCAADAFALKDTIKCNEFTEIVFGETGGGELFNCPILLPDGSMGQGPCDPAWATNPGVNFSQPYIASPDGNGYLWMGGDISAQDGNPRTVTSPTYNTTCGGSICFDFVFADGSSGQSGDNEQPDLYDEGISLQYSLDGGLTWVDISYWAPNGDSLAANPGVSNPGLFGPGPFETWQDDVCVDIPTVAQAAQVKFRFAQDDDSGTCCDHWGIDDINVSIHANTMDIFMIEPQSYAIGSTPDTISVSPTETDSCTRYVFYMNDFAYNITAPISVFDTVFVCTQNTDAGPDMTVSCSTVGVELSVGGVMPSSTVVWSPATGLSNPNIQNPWANPTNDQMYTVTSDCGSDSILIDVVPIFEPSITSPNDSICVGDAATLIASSDQPLSSYTYEWTNYVLDDTSATTSVTPSINTTYYVEMVSDSGCIRTDSIEVYVGAVPKTINYLGEMRVCRGDSTQITVDAIQPTIFDDFDNNGTGINLGIWSDIQNGIANTDCGSMSGDALHFNGTGLRHATTIPLNVLPSGGTISFDIVYGGFTAPGTSCNFVGFNDDVEFEYSTDGGVTWVLITDFSALGTFIWTHYDIVVPPGAAGPATLFRFNQPSFGGNDQDNWAIDNFLVELDCSGTGCVNYDYSWTPTTFVSDPNILNPFFYPNVTTDYTLVISPEGFDCNVAADVITIVVDELPITINPDDTFLCLPAPVLLDAEISGFSNTCDEVYSLTNIPYVLETGTGTTINFDSSDDGEAVLPLPFTFEFFCQDVTSVIAQTNGVLNMHDNAGYNDDYSPDFIPDNTFSPTGIIAMLWDDLSQNSTSSSVYFVNGSAPNRRFVVDFDLVHGTSGTGNAARGQIVLHETSNMIDITCIDCQAPNFGSATQGIENFAGSHGYPVPGRNLSLWSATTETWRFIPSNSPVNFDLTWSPNLNITDINIKDPLVNPTTSTDYVLEVLNINNCAFYDTASVNIFESMANITATPNPVCYGETVQLNATGADSFTWTPATGLSATNIANPVSSILTTTTYHVEFNTQGCTESDSIRIDVLPLPTTDINNGTNPVGYCEGSTGTIAVDNITGWTYSWTGPETGSGHSLEVSTAGVYEVEFNNGSCSDIRTVQVVMNETPKFDFSSVDSTLCCNDDMSEIVFNDVISNNNNINIQDIYVNGVATTDASINYVSEHSGNNITNKGDLIKVYTAEGCESTIYLPYVVTKCANPTISGPDTVYSNTSEIFDLTFDETNSNATSYAWTTTDPATGAITDASAEDAEVNGTDAGVYTLDLTIINTYDGEACPPETETRDYEVVSLEEPQYPDAFTPKDGDIRNDVFRPVVSPFADIKEFRVYNRWGHVVYDMSTADNKDGWDGTWNGVDQEADLYMYYMLISHPDKDFTKEGSVTLIR